MATNTIEVLPLDESPSSPDARALALRAPVAPLILITLFATILRIYAIASKSFWLDEGISVEIARLPWRQFLFVLRHREANMALYYLLLRFWLMMGSSEGFIRGLSVLFSVATIPVIYALGARLFGRNTGLLAGWILAIGAYHVRYAQEARGYALVVFFCVLASWLFVRNLQQPLSAHWKMYALVSALAVYSHFFAALVIIGHAVSLAFLPRTELPWHGLKLATRWLVYLLFPVATIVITVGAGSMSWIPRPNLHNVLESFVAISGNGGKLLLSMETVAIGATILIAVKAWRVGARDIREWGCVFALSWLLTPFVIVLAVSVLKPIFIARYLSPCVPALALAVAAGIARVRPPVLSWSLAAVISVMSLIGTVSYYRKDFDLDRDDWRAATSYVLDHARHNDGAVFYVNLGRLPFEFYKSLRHPAPPWPEALVAANGSDWGYRDSLFAYLGDELSDAGPGRDRVWVILDLDTDARGKPSRESILLRGVYGKGRDLVDEKKISRITVLLFARDSP